MFGKTLTFAVRSLSKYKMYTLVNLLGLTLGLTSALIIALYVIDELSYDRYHANVDRVYQVVAARDVPGQGTIQSTNLPAPLATAMEARFPEVEESFRMMILGRADLTYENNGYYELVIAVDPEFFQLLDYTFLQGSPETALTNPDGIVLTRSTAGKYFGDEDPMGKILTGGRGQNVVTAVVEDPPVNTHLQLDAIFPFPAYLNQFMPNWQSDWGNNAFTTNILLREDTDITRLQEELTNFIRNETPLPDASSYSLRLLALPDIHFGSGEISNGQVNFDPGDINSGPLRENRGAIRNEMLQSSNVLAVSNSSRLPGDWKPMQDMSANIPGRDAGQSIAIKAFNIDEYFLDTFSIRLLEGVNLTALTPEASVLINRTLAERLGPGSVLGQRLNVGDARRTSEVLVNATVVGVVEDFHFESLHQPIQPAVFGGNPAFLPIDYYSVKVDGNNLDETIAYLRDIVERHDPATPFEYNILDSRMNAFYGGDRLRVENRHDYVSAQTRIQNHIQEPPVLPDQRAGSGRRHDREYPDPVLSALRGRV